MLLKIGIYKFECDYGRSGTLSGIFTASEEQVSELLTKVVYLGEALGKHSEVIFEPGELESHITLVTDNPEAVSVFSKYSLYSGYDLTDYLEYEE